MTLSSKRYSLKFLDKILQDEPQDSSSDIAPLTSTWRHARDSFSQAFFPLRFCILQVIKTGGRNAWERGYWPQASEDDVQLNAIDNT